MKVELKDLPKNGLVDFYATWCGPCKMMEPIVDKIQDAGIRVVRVDVDENPDLAEYFRVMSVPTFVGIKNGKESSRKIGAMPESELLKLL